jgi:dTDP-4-dehydrorhamnose reductase
MIIGVTGYKGNIGSRLVNLGYIPLEFDVTKEYEMSAELKKKKPDVIIHLAEKSDVDFCEKLTNQELIIQTNFRGSGNVFKWANYYGIKVIYVSTDHLFSGKLFGSYLENSKPKPQNYYGQLKLAVEAMAKIYDNVKVVRTSTLFWGNRPCVQNPLLALSRETQIYLPVFMTRSFMHVDHFVEQLRDYCNCAFDTLPKTLNLSGSKTVSWYKFITAYAEHLKLDTSLINPRYWDIKDEITAPRPHRAGLDTKLSKSLGFSQYDYLDGIRHGA